jgi:hypothetical protein
VRLRFEVTIHYDTLNSPLKDKAKEIEAQLASGD